MNLRIKLLKYSVGAGVALSLIASGVAHADTTTITNTGPGSNNTANFVNNYNVVETNVNNVVASNLNNQTGATGNANVNDNTTGGNATSGSVNNVNSTSTAIAINNAGGSSTVTPLTPSSPSYEGQIAAADAKTGMLPKTGGDGINTSLFDKLYNARKGVIGPLAKAGSEWSWAMFALALALSGGLTVGYAKYFNPKNTQKLTTI